MCDGRARFAAALGETIQEGADRRARHRRGQARVTGDHQGARRLFQRDVHAVGAAGDVAVGFTDFTPVQNRALHRDGEHVNDVAGFAGVEAVLPQNLDHILGRLAEIEVAECGHAGDGLDRLEGFRNGQARRGQFVERLGNLLAIELGRGAEFDGLVLERVHLRGGRLRDHLDLGEGPLVLGRFLDRFAETGGDARPRGHHRPADGDHACLRLVEGDAQRPEAAPHFAERARQRAERAAE